MKQLLLKIFIRREIFFLFLSLTFISFNFFATSSKLESEKSSQKQVDQSLSSIKSSDTSIDSQTGKNCKLSGGEVVKSGWQGKDTGDNFCNNCFCRNGNLGCTKMYCTKDKGQENIPTSIPIPTPIPIPTISIPTFSISTPTQTPFKNSTPTGSYKLISGSLSKSFASVVAVLLPEPTNQDVKFKYKFIHSQIDGKPESINAFCDSSKLWSKTVESKRNSVNLPQESFPNEQGFIHLCVSYLSGYGKFSDWLRLNQTIEIAAKKNDSINMILCCNKSLTSASYKIKEQIKIPGKSDPITQFAIGVTKDLEGTIIFDSKGKIHSQYPSEIVVNLATLKSDSSLRDNYLKNNSLEINKYPKLTLTVKNVEQLEWPFIEGVYQSFKLYGDLEIHGVLRPSVWNVEAILENGNITGTAKTQFSFGDFNIKIPKVYVVYVEDKIELEIDFSATYLE